MLKQDSSETGFPLLGGCLTEDVPAAGWVLAPVKTEEDLDVVDIKKSEDKRKWEKQSQKKFHQ